MRKITQTLEMKTIRFLNRSRITTKWKTILTIILVSASSFSIGVFANRVVVQQVQSLAGNHVGVPAPELQVLNSFWRINLNQSLVTSLLLNVTTVGTPTTTIGVKLYQVLVQVSCLSTAGVPFTCSTGSTQAPLLTNMNGTSAILVVALRPPVDPENTEIDDLSFIVTATPVPSGPGVIGIVSSATPTIGPNGTAVQVTLMSINGFSGTLTLSANSLDPGIVLSPPTQNVTLKPGGTAIVPLRIRENSPVTGDSLVLLSFTSAICKFCPPMHIVPIPDLGCLLLPITITANPTVLFVGVNPNRTISPSVDIVQKTVSNGCGFPQLVTLSATVTPFVQGPQQLPKVSLPTGTSSFTFVVPSGGSVTVTETIDFTSVTPLLNSQGFNQYTITDTATTGSFSTSATVTVSIIVPQ